MNQNILHVGLDVDDTRYHGAAFNKGTGEVINFRCRPTLKGLLTQLDKLQRHFQGCSIWLCYEASYVGFHLQRNLRTHGWRCDVVAPSSIPSPRGKAVKTDRSVLSKPAGKTITVDCGSKAVSPDSAGVRGRILNLDGAIPGKQSEEHWVFTLDTAVGDAAVGDAVYILPTHICTTVALYDRAVTVGRNGEVTGHWPITARERV